MVLHPVIEIFSYASGLIKIRGHSGVVAKVLDYDFVVSEYELKSPNYVHFRTNTLGKSTKPP